MHRLVAAALLAATLTLLTAPHTRAQTSEPPTPTTQSPKPNPPLPKLRNTDPAAAATVLTGTPAPYVLRPGDQLTVNYRFTPEFDDSTTVAPDGRITLKNIGVLPAAGTTIAELQQRILTAAAPQLVNPEITVSLKEFERPEIVVGGEVQLPTHFQLRKPTTALQAILTAGGPKPDGRLDRVLLFRRISDDTAETHILDLRHLSTNDRASNDLLLQPGDMILVTHDRLTTVERYMKLVTLSVYFNPIGNNGLF